MPSCLMANTAEPEGAEARGCAGEGPLREACCILSIRLCIYREWRAEASLESWKAEVNWVSIQF